jgi:hypothetical protein
VAVSSDDAVLFSAAIAGELLGKADSSDAGHLRYGSISINLHKGTFFDTDVDEGGSLFDLVKQRKGFENGELDTWIEDVKTKERKRRADMAIGMDLPDLDDDIRCISAERALIGRVLVNADTLDLVLEELNSTDFSFEFHREVYMVMVDAHSRGESLALPQLIVQLGGDDGTEVVPGFTCTTYLVRLFGDAPADFDNVARDTAIMLRGLAEERQTPPDLDGPISSKFGALRWEDLDVPGPEHEWLVDNILSRCDRSIIAGPSKSGKSFLAIHLSMAVTRGVPFFGHKVRHGGVIYQAGEGSRGVKKRLRAYRKHFDVEKKLGTFVLLTKQVDLYRPSGDTDALIDEIRAWASTMPVPLELVVIDTLATATAGADENSVKDMSTVLANIARISAACDVHVMLVHHMNAAGTKLRGSTSIYANVDQVIEVINNTDTKIRTATLSKQKDDEDGLKFVFKLKRIDIDKRADGTLNNSCVVVSVEDGEVAASAAGHQGFRATDGEAAFYKALLTALGERGQKPPEGCAAPHGVELVVHYEEVKKIFRKQNLTEEADQRAEAERLKKALQRGRQSLARYECIGADNPWIWRTEKWVRGFPKSGAEIARQWDAEQMQGRLKELETKIDPGRSSSGLTTKGQTNPRDRR